MSLRQTKTFPRPEQWEQRQPSPEPEETRLGARPKIKKHKKKKSKAEKILQTKQILEELGETWFSKILETGDSSSGSDTEASTKEAIAPLHGQGATLQDYISIAAPKVKKKIKQVVQRHLQGLKEEPMTAIEDSKAQDVPAEEKSEDMIRIVASEGIPCHPHPASMEGKTIINFSEFAKHCIAQVSSSLGFSSNLLAQLLKSPQVIQLQPRQAITYEPQKPPDFPQSMQDIRRMQMLPSPKKEETTSWEQIPQLPQIAPSYGPQPMKAQISEAPTEEEWMDFKRDSKATGIITRTTADMPPIALPVDYDAQNQNPRWSRINMDMVKELIRTMREMGVCSPSFKQLLTATFNMYDLTPYDLRSIASMILTDTQMLLWQARWRRALEDLRNRYRGGPHAGITVAEMAGDPPHDNPSAQARNLPREVLTDIKEIARKTILQVPPPGCPETVYTEIKQGASEPFSSFMDRLTQAVDRQVTDELARPHLLRSLAYTNANAECQRIINALPGQPTLTEMVEACSKVGTPQHVANILGEQIAKAFQIQNENIKKTLETFQKQYTCVA